MYIETYARTVIYRKLLLRKRSNIYIYIYIYKPEESPRVLSPSELAPEQLVDPQPVAVDQAPLELQVIAVAVPE